ncbi:MAG: sugar phosphate isomerase/epimerase [Proteobacteria bacterium]|nr:sugar phosphate isomerase/epimerase [Pseudomonadota bacterium]
MKKSIFKRPQSRRNFLRTAAIAGLAVATPWRNALAQNHRVENVGLQLYSLRREMGQDFEGTLARLAEIGFKEMEFAGYFDKSPAEVKSILDNNGLISPAAHINLNAIRDNLQAEIEKAATIGQKYIVVPSLPGDERSLDHYARHAETLNRAGEACKEVGIQMGYHNHSFEFEVQNGKMGYDSLLNLTEPDLVTMEMDLYWIVNAGQDPIPYFENYPGRFALLHIKDRASDGSMVDVGHGTIDFANLLAYVEIAGFEHYFIEHDNPDDGINSIAYSYNTLNRLRF